MKKRHFLILFSIFTLTWGSIGWSFYKSLTLPEESPSESALRQTNQLLAEIQSHPGQSMQDDLAGYLRVNEDCWSFLQTNIQNNKNQYTLTVTKAEDNRMDPNKVHSLIEVYVDIDFADGNKAEMFVFQGALAGCHEITSR